MLYHSYLRQLAEEYIAGGGFDAFYDRTRGQIDALVENDPTAFYSYEEYNTAAEAFYEIVKLRGESISGQVDGTIPSVANEQKDPDALIDASHLDLSAMGSMSMDDMPDMGFAGSGSSVPGNVILCGGCFVVLIAAFVFVKLYRRRPRIK